MIYLKLFWTFFKIGAFTFGGGYAMIPLIQKEVERENWIAKEKIIDFIAISESTPGPFAVNISTYVGMETGGIAGAFLATLGVVLPSFIVILIVARCFEKYRESPVVKGCMSGLKPAVVGLIGSAVVSTAATVLLPVLNGNGESFWFSMVILVLTCVMAFKKVHPIFIILFSAVLGIIGGYLNALL